MINVDLLSQYDEILRQSLRMQAAAREGEWELLIELGEIRAAVSRAIMDQGRQSEGSLPNPSNKAELIRSILASDEETTSLILQHQHELKTTFHSIDTERKLYKAYAVMT